MMHSYSLGRTEVFDCFSLSETTSTDLDALNCTSAFAYMDYITHVLINLRPRDHKEQKRFFVFLLDRQVFSDVVSFLIRLMNVFNSIFQSSSLTNIDAFDW